VPITTRPACWLLASAPSLVHRLGRRHQLGEEVLALLPQVAGLAQAGDVALLDGRQRRDASLQRVARQLGRGVLVAVQHGLLHLAEQLVFVARHGRLL